jgi:phage baseplate assembly protein W
MNTDILGKGISVPLKTNSRGGIEKAQHEEKIRQSILIILGTQHGERKMRPDFGCNLKSLLFAPNNTATANLARFYVEKGLKKWEPRIQLEEVVIENDNREGRLLITVHYRIKSTNEANNLVYPFYLQQP